ncbi:GTPase/DUF3482 domain-containing protein [Ottowia thiooxydans]|uniref:GTPase/DUF3482 domain-containing protein n=1 Tax=Ottowia thiooxydans TaxID=219182 RepID=UPI00040AA159|nr:GTPase/DUF3482 domain-containing protein [Ottowia thiooxydans]
MSEPIRIAVVGHTNAGKTSLLRTLTRQVDFGEVSDRPGTTRHAEAIDLKVEGVPAVRFTDTPGLEDSIALQEYLNRLPGESRPERVRAFLQGPESREAFEQEAKVLRALLEHSDAAMLVIDTREPVLPKYRAEIEILTWCAKPVMPVLNFVRAPNSRRDQWRQVLLESNLHAQAEFDAVAPFVGAERQLYGDLGTLLQAKRQQLGEIVDYLARESADRRRAACRVAASGLVDVAALRRQISAEDFAIELRRTEFVRALHEDVGAHARRTVDELLQVFAFRRGDAEVARLPQIAARWEDDLFNTETLREAGKKLGLGAMIGAGFGAVADVAMAGLSLGAATTLGATIGGALSGGWKPLWRKLENRLNGVQELTVEDAVLLLMGDHLLHLIGALEHRGHAAMDKLRLSSGPRDGVGDGLRELVEALQPARGHPEWERGAKGRRGTDNDRQETLEDAARYLEMLISKYPLQEKLPDLRSGPI